MLIHNCGGLLLDYDELAGEIYDANNKAVPVSHKGPEVREWENPADFPDIHIFPFCDVDLREDRFNQEEEVDDEN